MGHLNLMSSPSLATCRISLLSALGGPLIVADTVKVNLKSTNSIVSSIMRGCFSVASDRSTEATEQPVKIFRPVTKLWFAVAARAGLRNQNKHDG